MSSLVEIVCGEALPLPLAATPVHAAGPAHGQIRYKSIVRSGSWYKFKTLWCKTVVNSRELTQVSSLMEIMCGETLPLALAATPVHHAGPGADREGTEAGHQPPPDIACQENSSEPNRFVPSKRTYLDATRSGMGPPPDQNGPSRDAKVDAATFEEGGQGGGGEEELRVRALACEVRTAIYIYIYIYIYIHIYIHIYICIYI